MDQIPGVERPRGERNDVRGLGSDSKTLALVEVCRFKDPSPSLCFHVVRTFFCMILSLEDKILKVERPRGERYDIRGNDWEGGGYSI